MAVSPAAPDVRVFGTKAQAAAAAAELIAEILRRADAEGRPSPLCLAGGETPKAVYSLLAQEPSLPWTRAEFYWGDERYNSPAHPDSNFRTANDLLLGPLGIPDQAVHRIPTGSADPALDAKRYEEALRSRWPKADAPGFDLLLLGFGRDGHTASLFPGGAELEETRRWVVAVKRGVESARITLTPPALKGARVTAFLAVGVEKAEAVRAAMRGAGDDCPARLVKPCGAAPVWLLDRDAAKLL